MHVPKSGSVASIQSMVARAERAAARAAREVGQEKDDARFDAERQKSEQALVQMQKTLEATHADFLSSFVGGALGALGGLLAGLAAPVTAPLIGVAPWAQPFVAAAIHVVAGLSSAALVGIQTAGMGKVIAAPYVASLKNDAAEAELRGVELEADIARLEQEGALSSTEADRARTAIRDARDALREITRYEEERSSALEGHAGEVVAGESAGAQGELRETGRAARSQQRAASSDAREARRQATEQRLASVEDKRNAIRERESQATLEAWLGVADLALKIAANVATLGAYSALGAAVNIAGGGAKIATALLVDGREARALDRQSEVGMLAADQADGRAREAEAKAQELGDVAHRAGDVAHAAAQKSGGGQVMVGGAQGVGMVAHLLAKLANDEARGARSDEKAAREAKYAERDAAIQKRREADGKEDAADEIHGVVSIVSGGLQALVGVGELAELANSSEALKGAVDLGSKGIKPADSLLKNVVDFGSKGVKIFDALAGAADQGARALIFNPDARALRRAGDDHEGVGKMAADREQDAKDERTDARERARRALDTALVAARGRSLA